MYETRIIVPSRRGKGLANIAVEDKKSSSKDKAVAIAIDAAVVIAILVFAYIAIEPLIMGSDPFIEFDESASELASSVRLYVADNQKQPSHDLSELGGAPLDPWGRPFIYDSFWERIVSFGPDGKLHKAIAGVPQPAEGEANDDLVYYCISYGSFWYSYKGDNFDEIGMMLPDGTGDTPFVPAVEAKRSLRYPNLSPDGQSLAYATLSAGGEWQLAISAANGSDVVPIPSIGDSRWPDWDPTGGSIYYESKRAGDDGILAYSVFRFDCTSEREEKVLSGRGNFRSPVVHPEYGDLMAYIFIKRGRKFPRICIKSADSGDSRDYSTQVPVPQKSPSWFAGGTELAYIARVDSRLQAFTMTVSSRKPIPIQGIPGDPQIIACSPSGRRVAVVSKSGSESKITVIDLNTNKSSIVHSSDRKYYSLEWGN